MATNQDSGSKPRIKKVLKSIFFVGSSAGFPWGPSSGTALLLKWGPLADLCGYFEAPSGRNLITPPPPTLYTHPTPRRTFPGWGGGGV